MSTKPALYSSVLCACLTCLACGDDDDEPSQPAICNPVVPCGGDVVATWDVRSFCLSQDAAADALATDLPSECSAAFVSADATPAGVTQTYTADGSVTTTGSVNLHNEYLFTEACLSALADDFASLGSLEAACQAVIDGNFSGIQFENPDVWELDCVESSGACDCDATGTVDLSSTDSYTLSGSNVITSTATAPYCVSGDELTVTIPAIAGDAFALRSGALPR